MMIRSTAGIVEPTSERSMFLMPSIMSIPTIIRIGEVAATGTMPDIGVKNIPNKNNAAVITEVKPVRPPAIMPELLSILSDPD